MATVLDIQLENVVIFVCAFLGLAYSIVNAIRLSQSFNPQGTKLTYSRFEDEEQHSSVPVVLEVGYHIQEGAKTFLYQEYKAIALFCSGLALVIYLTVEQGWDQFWVTWAFVTGALTSLLAGFIGMRVATFSNYRCALKAQDSMTNAFRVAFQAGCVMGFSLCSLGILQLLILIAIYNNWFMTSNFDLFDMYEKIAGFGLGGSTMALFGRVGGGIFTKAADVGADLVGKVEEGMDEDSPHNPATIADNVGDNVGDIAGMGSDLFGSFAEATCASFVISSSSPSFYFNPAAIYYPLLISALSLVACIFVTFIATVAKNIDSFERVQNALKWQLILSTLLLIPTLYLAAALALPDQILGLASVTRSPVHAWLCSVVGLVAGVIIGFVTEYYTSHSYEPVRQVVRACETGAATNVIYGLALGQVSSIIPTLLIAFTVLFSFNLLGNWGICLSALGMLSNLSLALAIDAYGPVSDNAGGIAEMADLGEETRARTDQLDAAGNCTAAIGKGFAIGSAGLVSLSLYGAFLYRASNISNIHQLTVVDLTDPIVLASLLVGAMLPYAFSAWCLEAVGSAAGKMVEEVRRQLKENPGIRDGSSTPDHNQCIAISTTAALDNMVGPAAIVLLTPFVFGFFFGPIAIAGLLPGALASGLVMATSQANTGGAWDNAKKYIESGAHIVNGVKCVKGSNEHKAAVIGDTVGDPLKDTSGPALNILIKLMAIFSLVFASYFDKSAYALCYVSSTATGC